VVGDAFDARHSAVARTYRYTVVNRAAPDPFLARYAWWVPEPLELARLRLGADPFVGEHDFAAFCRKGPEGSTTRRRVLRSHWDVFDDGILRYEIRATAFCWQMVRSIVGTLVEIGRGRHTPGDIMGMLRSGDRRGPASSPRPRACASGPFRLPPTPVRTHKHRWSAAARPGRRPSLVRLGIWNAHVHAQGRRHHPHVAHPRRRGQVLGSASRRGGHAAAGQAQGPPGRRTFDVATT
jgi:hypothetical protein